MVEFSFATEDVEIVQDLEFDVNFFVELNTVTSPVNDRVLTLSGRIANPSLTTAHLVLDSDIDQVFQVNLSDGYFSQNVDLEASNTEVSHHDHSR